MLAVVKQHRLIFLRCCEVFVSVVAIVEKVQANLVEQQGCAEYYPRDSMYAPFFHSSKITILNSLYGRS